VWEKPEVALGFGIVLGAIKAHGKLDVPVPEGPPFFRFSEPAECERTLAAAGFTSIRISRVPQVWRFDSPDGLFDAIYEGGVRIRAILRGQTAAAFEAIRNAVAQEATRHAVDGRIELPMPSIIASATKAA
jgi:hypothetical protein